MTATIVADTNFLAALLLPLPWSGRAVELYNELLWRGDRLIAPSLWRYEMATTLRKSIHSEGLSAEQERVLLRDLGDLEVTDVPPTSRLIASALAWARRLDVFVAYDASYLAVAEAFEAELWTADRRLAARVEASGTLEVRLVLIS